MVGLELGLHTPVLGNATSCTFFSNGGFGDEKGRCGIMALGSQRLHCVLLRLFSSLALGHLEIHHDWYQISTNQLIILVFLMQDRSAVDLEK